MNPAVKFLPLLLAASVAAQAGSNDPGSAALDFLEKVRHRKLDLEPGGDTALSRETADDKRKEIRHRLDQMAKDLGSDKLEVGEVKQDENFAAVLIRKSSGFDPSRLRIFPVAVVKRDETWSVAPVPASFENAGAGYAVSLRKRLQLLEDWMLREQVIDLEKMREQSARTMREDIEGHLPAGELRSSSGEHAATLFLAACERGDLPAVLGLLGGLSAKLPDDWPLRLKSASGAFGPGMEPSGPWRLLGAPEILRVVVEAKETRNLGSVSLACLDPTGGESQPPHFEVVPLDLARGTDGLWQVNLPSDFLQSPEETGGTSNPPSSLLFPAKWAAIHPPVPQPTAELAKDAWISALREPTMQPLLSIMDFPAGSEAARDRCISAAKTWAGFHDRVTVNTAVPLDFKADGQFACDVFEVFATRDLASARLMPVYFEKSPAGWLWAPVPDRAAIGQFQGWLTEGTANWSATWQNTLFQPSPVLEKLDGHQPPTKDDAKICVETWFAACEKSDVASAISQTVRLDGSNSGSAILQNAGYEIAGFRRSKESPVITGIYQGKLWTAVGVKIEQPDGKPSFPLYPVVQTARGARLLAEVSLSASRTRDFLNKTAFSHLADSGSPEAAEELRTLYAEHQDTVEKPLHPPAR